jgi:hypothetical protein
VETKGLESSLNSYGQAYAVGDFLSDVVRGASMIFVWLGVCLLFLAGLAAIAWKVRRVEKEELTQSPSTLTDEQRRTAQLGIALSNPSTFGGH